jgi:hypothetical protein
VRRYVNAVTTPRWPRGGLSRYTGARITYGLDEWDGHSEHWSCGWAKDPDGEIIDGSNVVDRLQDFVKVDVPITVHQASHWHLELAMAAIGIVPGALPEQNEAAFSRLVEPTFAGESRRAVLADVFKTQPMEYTAHDRELGFTYPQGAVVDDGSPVAWRDPMGAEYRPTTRPGSRPTPDCTATANACRPRTSSRSGSHSDSPESPTTAARRTRRAPGRSCDSTTPAARSWYDPTVMSPGARALPSTTPTKPSAPRSIGSSTAADRRLNAAPSLGREPRVCRAAASDGEAVDLDRVVVDHL